MADTFYDSELKGEQIDKALKAIDGLIVPSNNGKVVAVQNGKLVAKSASEWGGETTLESLSVTVNGDYYPGAGVDGFDEVHVSVPSEEATIQPLNVTQNGIYTAPSGIDGYSPVTVNVQGGSADYDYSYLPNSDRTKILASNDYTAYSYDRYRHDFGSLEVRDFAVMAGAGGQSTPFIIDSDGIIINANEKRIVRSLSGPNTDVTCYCVVKWKSGNVLGYILSVMYSLSYGQYPLIAINGSTGAIVTSVWGDDTTYSQYNGKEFNVYAIAIDSENKVARYFINGNFLGQKSIVSSGNSVSLGCATPFLGNTSAIDVYFKYGGVVEAFESDATIIANMQTIMQKFGIGL